MDLSALPLLAVGFLSMSIQAYLDDIRTPRCFLSNIPTHLVLRTQLVTHRTDRDLPPIYEAGDALYRPQGIVRKGTFQKRQAAVSELRNLSTRNDRAAPPPGHPQRRRRSSQASTKLFGRLSTCPWDFKYPISTINDEKSDSPRSLKSIVWIKMSPEAHYDRLLRNQNDTNSVLHRDLLVETKQIGNFAYDIGFSGTSQIYLAEVSQIHIPKPEKLCEDKCKLVRAMRDSWFLQETCGAGHRHLQH
ncbi:MAG: hypothetical protein J3Q66DRAFT_372040 [Benniella sp.]|nr:MAG: hypothetical protein J3Q66DRAFT_372040 [Benniella sp.]